LLNMELTAVEKRRKKPQRQSRKTGKNRGPNLNVLKTEKYTRHKKELCKLRRIKHKTTGGEKKRRKKKTT